MSSVKRLVDEKGPTNGPERALLRSAAAMDVDPPEGAKQAVWAALAAASMAAAATTVAAGTAKSAAQATSMSATGVGSSSAAVIAKAVVVIGLACSAAAIGAWRGTAHAPAPPGPIHRVERVVRAFAAAGSPSASAPDQPIAADPPAPTSAGSALPAARAPIKAPTPAVTASPTATPGPAPVASADASAAPSPSDSAARVERASRLREESQLLGRARAALVGGDARGALELLERARTQFPSGVLAQERDALAVEALARSGQRAAAAQRAAAFLRAYPESPLAPRVQPFLP